MSTLNKHKRVLNPFILISFNHVECVFVFNNMDAFAGHGPVILQFKTRFG